MAYYKVIDGIRYDRSLLDSADIYTRGRGESRLSLEEIKIIYGIATDARTITETEWRTLKYIAGHYSLTAPAKTWLEERFAGSSDLPDLNTLLHRMLGRGFGLPGLKWLIAQEEANRQHKDILTVVDFPAAVRSAIHAFSRPGLGQLTLEAMVRLQTGRDLGQEEVRSLVRAYLNDGSTLFLVPEQAEDRQELPYDLPDFLNFQGFWYIGLHVPKLSPVLFMASIPRSYSTFVFHRGYISRTLPFEERITAIVRQLSGFKHLEWQIEQQEVARQLKIQKKQNFGQALFAALRVGIFNSESKLSLRDLVQEEVQPEPTQDLEPIIREYVDSGSIQLLSPEGGPDFPYPDGLAPDFEQLWAFGLKMPQKTTYRFIITVTRRGDLDFSWNDGFLVI